MTHYGMRMILSLILFFYFMILIEHLSDKKKE